MDPESRSIHPLPNIPNVWGPLPREQLLKPGQQQQITLDNPQQREIAFADFFDSLKIERDESFRFAPGLRNERQVGDDGANNFRPSDWIHET